jgi:hypothetical protein
MTFKIGDKVFIRKFYWGTERLEPNKIVSETKTQYIVGPNRRRYKKATLNEVGKYNDSRIEAYCATRYSLYVRDSNIRYYRHAYRRIDCEISDKLTDEEALKFGELVRSFEEKYKEKGDV